MTPNPKHVKRAKEVLRLGLGMTNTQADVDTNYMPLALALQQVEQETLNEAARVADEFVGTYVDVRCQIATSIRQLGEKP